MFIKAAIFDMDGLLFDTERLAIKTWNKAGLVYGFDINEEIVIEAIGGGIKNTKEIFYKHLGKSLPFDDVYNLRNKLALDHIEKKGMPIKEGVIEVLNVFKKKKIKLAVATSTDTSIAIKNLKLAGIIAFFQSIIGGDQVKLGKPNPKIYLKASSKLKTKPSNCIVFEDSDNGILAATSANMRSVLIPDVKKPSIEIINKCYKKYESMKDVINNIDFLLN